jgi:hypothetical protein
VWCRTVELLGTVAVLDERSTVLTLHCSRTVAVCLHALHAMTALPVRTSCRPMVALMSGTLETCARALGTRVPSYTGRPARLFFMLEARGPQVATRHITALEPTSAERQDSDL